MYIANSVQITASLNFKCRSQETAVGQEGYDKGAKILNDFFKSQLVKFNTPELDPLGKKIIECCLNDGTLEDYLELMPMT